VTEVVVVFVPVFSCALPVETNCLQLSRKEKKKLLKNEKFGETYFFKRRQGFSFKRLKFDQNIKYSHEVNKLFEKRAENAL
jgi:hypothetical protein